MVVVPLGKKIKDGDKPVEPEYLQLPENSPDQWTNILTGEVIQTQRKLLLARCFSSFPVAVFVNEI